MTLPPEIKEEEQPQTPDESDVLLCPHCVKTITPFDHFCPHCNGPVTSYASVDPVGETRSLGYVFSQALDRAPHPFVFYGAWLIILPQLLGLAANFFFAVPVLIGPAPPERTYTADPFPIVLVLLLSFVVGAIYTAILYQLTRKYVARPTTTPDSSPAD